MFFYKTSYTYFATVRLNTSRVVLFATHTLYISLRTVHCAHVVQFATHMLYSSLAHVVHFATHMLYTLLSSSRTLSTRSKSIMSLLYTYVLKTVPTASLDSCGFTLADILLLLALVVISNT